ncbi:hypothetical protein FOL47_010598 [Perkinsus chesapeaki]|uniref:Uncharacterized protein n=1 Tax=Perkinsus chesapeaki TaxID=330153 RepID=A0A7J6L1J8_PERCH|nr:hypothetical protein FOL47_010598 [Perkinsus chesapeaki]
MFISLTVIPLISANILTADGLCDTVKQIPGYLHGGSDVLLYYWFFESRKAPTSSPTLVYFQGGPGASSMYSVVSGNGGPCILNREGNDTSLNTCSYNTFANILYIDQPAPTGFSKGTSPKNSDKAATFTLRALETFFAKYPEYNTEVFFIGQSYAGHYIPPLAQLTVTSKSLIKLKGVILGNSEVNTMLQCASMPTMAYASGTSRSVLSEKEYQRMLKSLSVVMSDAQQCLKHKDSREICQNASNTYYDNLILPIDEKNIDIFDLRLDCVVPPPKCHYIENFNAYFNSKKVQAYLKVKKKWSLNNGDVSRAFLADSPVDYSPDLSLILNEGLRVLVYAGDQDYACNWIGNRDMTLEIRWSGRDGFSKAPDTLYLLPTGQQVGKLKSFTFAGTGGQLSFAQIFKAGHSAAKDSPEGVLQLVSDFVLGRIK